MPAFQPIYLLVCPMLFLAGFVDSVAGGGGLISLPSYLFVGIPIHLASGTNKVINAVGTAVATRNYVRSGHVDLRVALMAAGGALVGGALGAGLANRFSEQLLQTFVLVTLPLVAVVLAVKKDWGSERAQRNWTAAQRAVLSVLIGLVIGLYDGLIGPGTGTFLIMAFTLILGTDLLTASGCAKVANLTSNVAAAVSWIVHGQVLWNLVFPATLCCVLGNWFGARYAIRGGTQKIRRMIFVVLALLFVKMGWELFF